jgi:predicted alpha/beta-fold hydrolase
MTAIDAKTSTAQSFRARSPWIGGDLQTLRNFLTGKPADLSAWPGRPLTLGMKDGSGDALAAKLHGEPGPDRPLLVLIHGLTGCEDSKHVRTAAAHALSQGYAVLRLNLRGAAPGRKLARAHYHAGRSGDLADALRALSEQVPSAFEGGLFLTGYSLGGNLLLKFLAEEGQDLPVTAAASVSAPVDLKAAQERIMAPRNRLYHNYLLRRMKAEALATPGGLEEPYASRVPGLTTLFDYDDAIVGPRNGFAGADDYYRRCSAKAFLPAIDQPVLVVHAEDDPWIPADSYRLPVWEEKPNLRLLMPSGGGHVGFHAADHPVPWHERRILEFFESVQPRSSRAASTAA